jgi:hypothetical protein
VADAANKDSSQKARNERQAKMRRRERRKEQDPIGGIKSCIKLACAITYILYGQGEFHSYKLQPRKSQTPDSICLVLLGICI